MTEARKKLEQDVKRFLELYQVISPESRAQLEAGINSLSSKLDQKTKALYEALLQTAKLGQGVGEAIDKMGQASQDWWNY